MAGTEFWGHREPDGNLKGTCWEQRKNEKNSSSHSLHPPANKKCIKNISQEQTFMMKNKLKNKFVRREFMV